jgi:hypothetical protein
MKKLPRFVAFLIIIGLTSYSYSSEFKLKNVPEKYAELTGAVVKEDSTSIVIMTETTLRIFSLDAIEIVERTRSDDKDFIKKYGPTNEQYQEFIGNKPKPKEEVPVFNADGERSIAKPDETYKLEYGLQKGDINYIRYQGTLKTKTELDNIPTPALAPEVELDLNFIFSLIPTYIDNNGRATLKVGIVDADVYMNMQNRKRRMPDKPYKEIKDTMLIDKNGKILSSSELKIEDSGGKKFDLTGFFIYIPSKPISVGDSWNYEQEETLPGLTESVLTNNEVKLVDIVEINGETYAKLQSTATSEVPKIELELPGSGGRNIPGTGLTLTNLNSESYYTSYFSLKQNQITRFNSKSNVTYDMEIKSTEAKLKGSSTIEFTSNAEHTNNRTIK